MLGEQLLHQAKSHSVYWYGTRVLFGLAWLVLTVSVMSCTSRPTALSKDGFSITDIEVTAAGAGESGQAYTSGVCKGFLLSEQQVMDFFVHANHIHDTAPENRYDVLPCYSSGTATINDAPYHWVIRAGGIGEFKNERYSFVKICGANCCDKVQGIC